MGRWGTAGNEDFNVTTLSNNFDDNKKVALLPQVTQVIIYLNYTKGSETRLEVRFRYAHKFDTPKVFYQESLLDINTQQVTLYVMEITASGPYRIPLPVGVQEDQIEVAVRGIGVPSPTGTATLDFVTDSFQ